jgi:hypothetical protein
MVMLLSLAPNWGISLSVQRKCQWRSVRGGCVGDNLKNPMLLLAPSRFNDQAGTSRIVERAEPAPLDARQVRKFNVVR